MYRNQYYQPYGGYPRNFSWQTAPFAATGNFFYGIAKNLRQGGLKGYGNAAWKTVIPAGVAALAAYGGKKLYDKFTERPAVPQYLPPEMYQQPDMFNPAPMNPEVQMNQMTAGIADAESMQRRAQVEAPAQKMIAQQAAAQPNNNVNYYQAQGGAPKAFSRVSSWNFAEEKAKEPKDMDFTDLYKTEQAATARDYETDSNNFIKAGVPKDTVREFMSHRNDMLGITNPFSPAGFLRGIKRDWINPAHPVAGKLMAAAKIAVPAAILAGTGYKLYSLWKEKQAKQAAKQAAMLQQAQMMSPAQIPQTPAGGYQPYNPAPVMGGMQMPMPMPMPA